MIVLFKKRNFSELLNDSFAFFRQNGKHYFKNYFLINGGFLLILMALLYFIFKVYFELLFSGIGASGQNFTAIEQYFDDHTGIVVVSAVAFILLAIAISLLHYAFPVVYLQLYEKNEGTGFSTKDLLQQLKSKTGKILIFFIASFFILIPIAVLTMGIGVLLVFILIGIPLLLILLPAFISWVSLIFYDYLNNEIGYFAALKRAFVLLRKKFWVIVGITVLIYLIIQIVLTITSIIPYMIGLLNMFTTMNDTPGSQKEHFLFFSVMMVIAIEISFALNYILGNLMMVSQGLIYYSGREEDENKSSQSEIDSIGGHFE
jgi:hypothetical protein